MSESAGRVVARVIALALWMALLFFATIGALTYYFHERGIIQCATTEKSEETR